MGWSGGVFTLTDGTFTSDWAQNWRDTGGAEILATEFDALLLDVRNGINACLNKDGSNAATANLDIGSNKITALADATVATDAAAYGQTITALAFDSGTNILTATRNAGDLTADFSGLAAGTGGVDLTNDQTVAGIKTWTSIGSHAHAKLNGPTTEMVSVLSSSSTPTCDTTATNAHFLSVNQNMTLDFTWPTDASDAELGANWKVHGAILMRWAAAGYTITLDSTMLSALTDYEIEGTHTTGSGEMSHLVYTYYRVGSSRYAQFAWVATP